MSKIKSRLLFIFLAIVLITASIVIRRAKAIDFAMIPAVRLQDNCWNIYAFGFERSFIDRGDRIVIANPKEKDPPVSQRTALIRRVIAMPGESIEIKRRQVFIDNKTVQSYNPAFTYRFNLKDKSQEEFLKKYSISLIQETAVPLCYDALVDETTAKLLEKDPSVSQFRLLDDPSRFKDVVIYPFSMTNEWTLSDYGTYLVPAKGDRIELNAENTERYKHILTNYEGLIFNTDNQKFMLEGSIVNDFTFQHNYYFVLSDNRDFGNDSRTFGPIPDFLIRGILIF